MDPNDSIENVLELGLHPGYKTAPESLVSRMRGKRQGSGRCRNAHFMVVGGK